jgi:hypothetical protein
MPSFTVYVARKIYAADGPITMFAFSATSHHDLAGKLFFRMADQIRGLYVIDRTNPTFANQNS